MNRSSVTTTACKTAQADESEKNLCACDYRDMNRLREITGNHPLTLLLIHHTRKIHAPDNQIKYK